MVKIYDSIECDDDDYDDEVVVSYDILDYPDIVTKEPPSRTETTPNDSPVSFSSTPHALKVSTPVPVSAQALNPELPSEESQTSTLCLDTPTYLVLEKYGLLNTSYRKDSFEDIFEETDLAPNSSHSENMMKRMRWGVYWTPGCGFLLYSALNTEITIPPKHICRFIDNDNNYLFAKPGVHNVKDPFTKKIGYPENVLSGYGRIFEHGNRTVVTVPQGHIGYATDRGNPVLLPPGLHAWVSETIRYERTQDLGDRVVRLGPYTIVTVDEGYVAITRDNGKRVILTGGGTHLLTHPKWRFEQFITLQIQTDELKNIEAATVDNILMSINSTVVWKIEDINKSANILAAEITPNNWGVSTVTIDINKLRNDVLKQVIASLATFIGTVNYSNTLNVPQAVNYFVLDKHTVTTRAVTHANSITSHYGVQICSINIISAKFVNSDLTASLANGVLATVESLREETRARALANAKEIEAKSSATTRKIAARSEADAKMVRAKAEGESDILLAKGMKQATIVKAEGSLEAARLLEGSEVAVRLETMRVGAAAIGENDKFFFGQEPEYMAGLIMKGGDGAVHV